MKKEFILGTIFVMAIFALGAQQGTGNVVTDYTSAGGPEIRYIGDYAILDGVLISYSGDDEHLVIPANLGITEIGTGVFILSNLRSVSIPEGVTVIGEKAFMECFSLQSVTFPETLVEIGSLAFNDCRELESLTIPNNVTNISNYAFSGLTSINIGSGLNDIEPFLWGTLQNFNVDANNPYFSSIDGVLFNKDVTELIRFRKRNEEVYIVPNSVTTIGSSAFSAPGLRSVFIPANVHTIDYYAFVGCPNLLEIIVDERNLNYASVDGVLFDSEMATLIKFPEGRNGHYSIPNTVNEISRIAFSGSSLSSITMSNSMSMINEYTFYWSRGLTSVIIPENVNFIGSHAFNGSITNIHIGSNVDIHELAFGRTGFSGNHNRFFNHFFQLYRRTGRASGTYTRPDTNSTTWVYTP